MVHQGRIVAVNGGQGIIKGSQQIFLDVADIGGVFPHTVQHILDVRIVQLQKPGFDHFRRIVVPSNADCLPSGTDGVHHELHQLVQTVTVHALVLYEDVIFDVLQNQFPIALSLPHPVLSDPFGPCGGLIG